MILKTCMLTANRCYIRGQKMTNNKPTGIVVHSTGANNPTLKRYVQPLTSDANYEALIADIGKNSYGNHWNRAEATACVHAFIGKNAAGVVETYQTLPFNICCWGVASGSKGSYNYNPTARVQFEICEDGLTDATYFAAAMREAQELCAHLCKTYGFGVDRICSHQEAYRAGYGSNHGDPHHWLSKHGKSMDWFRAEVQRLINGEAPTYKPTVLEWQKAAIADGFAFPRYGADGKWGAECKGVAKKAIVKRRLTGYRYRNLTKIVQRVVGVDVDGLCGRNTDKAIRAWQAANGLAVDGSVGPATWHKMLGV